MSVPSFPSLAARDAAALVADTSAVGGATAIRPFRVNVPEEAVAELRQRVAATRWPDTETVIDRSQGVQLTKIQDLVHYYFHEADKGGHFAAWEQPHLFAAEIRAAFRSLRTR